MRYTEKEHRTKSEDILDVIRNGVFNFFLAPYRLFNEISQKIMYMGKEAIEKLGLVSVVLVTALLLIDVISFVLTKNISLIKGASPILIKFLVLLMLGYFLTNILSKFKFMDSVERGTYRVGEEDIPGDEEFDYEEETEVYKEEETKVYEEQIEKVVVSEEEDYFTEEELRFEEALNEAKEDTIPEIEELVRKPKEVTHVPHIEVEELGEEFSIIPDIPKFEIPTGISTESDDTDPFEDLDFDLGDGLLHIPGMEDNDIQGLREDLRILEEVKMDKMMDSLNAGERLLADKKKEMGGESLISDDLMSTLLNSDI